MIAGADDDNVDMEGGDEVGDDGAGNDEVGDDGAADDDNPFDDLDADDIDDRAEDEMQQAAVTTKDSAVLSEARVDDALGGSDDEGQLVDEPHVHNLTGDDREGGAVDQEGGDAAHTSRNETVNETPSAREARRNKPTPIQFQKPEPKQVPKPTDPSTRAPAAPRGVKRAPNRP